MTIITIPKGISKVDFDNVCQGAVAAVQYFHRIPTVPEINKFVDIQPKKISQVLATKEFKEVMRLRGYDFSNHAKLSPEQVWCVSIITDPTNRKPLKDKLTQAGITYWEYKAWLAQPHFAEYVKEIGERLLNDHVHDVHTKVVERATNGDIQAMRLYYDLIGRTDSTTNKAVADLSATVRLLLEVITRNVTDTRILAQITNEIQQITQGKSNTNSISDFGFENIQNDTVKSEVVPEPIGKDWNI